MKFLVLIFGVVFAFFLGDFLWSQRSTETRNGIVDFIENDKIPFDHKMHGDSLGLDCAACHTGARSGSRALMPSKTDCMDCHRLPLTENEGIEKLDSALKEIPEHPWKIVGKLPEHVFFHHGVHAAAGVTCADCHGRKDGTGNAGYLSNSYGGEKFDMMSCIKCHRGESFRDRNFKKAATYCAACHR